MNVQLSHYMLLCINKVTMYPHWGLVVIGQVSGFWKSHEICVHGGSVMGRFTVKVLGVGLYLLSSAVGYGQPQKFAVEKVDDTRAAIPRLEEPVSTESASTVATGTQAVVPRLMKFSGVLHDVAGKPLIGTIDVSFSLYSSEAGGSPLWFETQSVEADELGRYTVLLGAMHTEGLPIDLFT